MHAEVCSLQMFSIKFILFASQNLNTPNLYVEASFFFKMYVLYGITNLWIYARVVALSAHNYIHTYIVYSEF